MSAAPPAIDSLEPAAPSPGTVVGDGTTGASRLRSRWRRARLAVYLALAALVVVLSVALLPAPTSTVPYAVDNAGPDGARAVAEVLRSQGVDVTATGSATAAASAAAGTTLVVAPGVPLTPAERSALAAARADLVLLDPGADLVARATDDAVESAYAVSAPVSREASCDDPDARAAGTAVLGGSGLRSQDPAVTLCFPGLGAGAGYAVTTENGRTVRAVSDADVVTNDSLLEEGDAALALRMLGHHERLVWFVPDGVPRLGVPGTPGGSGDAPGLLPPWVGAVGLELVLVVLVVALWRGRRLGRLVIEDLPVVVRSSETTRGRGRLYRAAGSRGHAAAGLRALTAARLADRLGLPRSSGPPALVDAVARSCGWAPDDVDQLLYGPPPTDDRALLMLAHRLDTLESEVHPL